MRFSIKRSKWGILAVWIGYVVFLFVASEGLSRLIEASNAFIAVLVYLIGNPLYILTIFGIITHPRFASRKAWKKVMASLMVIIGADMVTFPRLSFTTPLTNGMATTTNIGAIFMRAMESIGFPHWLAFFFQYGLLPILLIWIAMEQLGVVDFVKQVGGK